MEYKIGIGYDIHRLVKGRKLFLGGVEVAYPKGLLGHSDADVVLHAICDALLGACGAGDIGELFPDSDPEYRNIASIKILAKTGQIIARKGFSIANIDTVIIAEEPKILPLRERIRQNISRLLKIKAQAISIKGKTNEKLGELGQERAIAVFATALLRKGK